MKTFPILHSILLLVLLSGCVSARKDLSALNDAKELVLDQDFPDPAILLASDGYYYAYATQTADETGRTTNLQVARSRNLKTWDYLGEGLPVKPPWASKTQKIWAPHVTHYKGQYILYYSADPNTLSGLCLAVATSKTPAGPFVDIGKPLQCGKGFVNIDPMFYHDLAAKRAYLFWGSGFGPIKAQQLSEDGLQLAKDSKPVDLIFPNPDKNPENYQKLVEGAWVIQEKGWYYLFYSGDNCCEPDPHYAVMVARSKNLLGPYQPQGKPFLMADTRWLAPGHNAFLKDAEGESWLYYHAIDQNQRHLKTKIEGDRNVRRVMLRSRVEFYDGGVYLTQPK